MAFTVSFQYGASTPVSVTYGITVARSKAMSLRYANLHGLVLEGMTDAQIAEAIIRHIMKGVADEAAAVQQGELIASEMATVKSTVALDNALDP